MKVIVVTVDCSGGEVDSLLDSVCVMLFPADAPEPDKDQIRRRLERELDWETGEAFEKGKLPYEITFQHVSH